MFKNIRSNWCTEKTQTLDFQHPQTNKKYIAKSKDLTKIYKEETDSSIGQKYLKETKLDYTTVHPNNFKKQKVCLFVNIFNEKTVAKLEGRKGMERTHMFVQLVSRLWDILNTRSSDAAKLKVSDSKKVTAPNDLRLDFLLQMATVFKEMEISIRCQYI